MARHVETELYNLVSSNISDIVAVRVNSFANGSVIADFYVVMNSTVPKDTHTPDLLQMALKTAAKYRGTYTSLHLDPDYEHEITGE